MAPSGWEKTRLHNLVDFRNGLNFTKKDNGDTIKIVGVSDFKNLSILPTFENLEKITIKENLKDEDLIISNDLLFVRSNGNKDLIGRCLFFPFVNEKISFSGFTIRARVNDSKLLPAYLSIFSQSTMTKSQFFQLGSGTNISNLSQQILKNIEIDLPPRQEQQKIVKILSTWDKAITITENLIANSEMQKKALMQQLLTGKKRLLDENGVRFSGDWDKVPLSSKITFSNLKSTKKDEYPIITSSRKGIFLQEDYFKKQVASENNIGYKVVPRDYITYRSMSDDGIFVFNKQTILDTAIISPAYGVFKFINLDASFGLYAMNSKHMMGKINTFSQGGTRIALKTSVLSNIKIHIPSLLEQKKIAKVLSNADREIELLQAKLRYLKQEKKALMQQLLTGKRRVVIN